MIFSNGIPATPHSTEGKQWERAFHYHELAGQKAAAAYANPAVVEHCRAALEIGKRLDVAPPDPR